MKINEDIQSKIKPLQNAPFCKSITVKTRGYVKSLSDEAIVVKLDTNDKKMTLSVG